MSVFSEKQLCQYREWLKGFTNFDLVRHIEVLERLLGTDDMLDSLLVDEAIALLDILRDECVRRISVLSELTDSDNCLPDFLKCTDSRKFRVRNPESVHQNPADHT